MNKEELIGKLQMTYVGDRNAFNELVGYYDGLKQGIEELQQENKHLQQQLDQALKDYEDQQGMVIVMEKYLELIHDLAFDYDGLNDIESLKKLIDELDRYARLGRCCNTSSPIYINGDENYNILNEKLEKGDSNE